MMSCDQFGEYTLQQMTGREYTDTYGSRRNPSWPTERDAQEWLSATHDVKVYDGGRWAAVVNGTW